MIPSFLNNSIYKFILFISITVYLVGCSVKSDVSAGSPASKGDVYSGDASASVVGEVRFTGEVPPPRLSSVKSFTECAVHHKGNVHVEDILVLSGKLQNAFVYVKEGLEGKRFKVPEKEVILDQIGCIYEPHILGLQTGQTLLIKNSDVSFHNVHSHSTNQKSFNIGMPVQGMKIKKLFDTPEVMISLTCDIHPWMKSYVGVLNHPYYSLTGENGAFELRNLPPGSYTLEAWHEVYGRKTQTLTLGSDDVQEVVFTYP